MTDLFSDAFALPIMWTELAVASWETVWHRTALMASGACTQAEYERMVPRKDAGDAVVRGGIVGRAPGRGRAAPVPQARHRQRPTPPHAVEDNTARLAGPCRAPLEPSDGAATDPRGPQPACGGFLPAGRGGRTGRGRGRRLAAPGRDGRPLRPQHQLRPGHPEGIAAADEDAVRRASDDRAGPDPYIAAFAEAGADHIMFHPEAGPHPHRTLQADPRRWARRPAWC